jgi:hypothetical protein
MAKRHQELCHCLKRAVVIEFAIALMWYTFLDECQNLLGLLLFQKNTNYFQTEGMSNLIVPV